MTLDQNPSRWANPTRALATASLSREYGLKSGFVYALARSAPKLGRFGLSGMQHRPRRVSWCCAAVVAALIGLGGQPGALAQQGEAAAPSSKGENFSAKPPAQLFASDCTGAGCHKSPQGLAKSQGIGLAGFLREHYTNSRESAAALASYLAKLSSGPEPREARTPRGGKLPPAAPASSGPGWFGAAPNEAAAPRKPAPKEERAARQHPNSRASHTAARPEEPAATKRHDLDGGEAQPPTPQERTQRSRNPAAAATAAAPLPPPNAAESAPSVAAAPEPTPAAPESAPSAPAAPAAAPPAPKRYDIFD